MKKIQNIQHYFNLKLISKLITIINFDDLNEIKWNGLSERISTLR